MIYYQFQKDGANNGLRSWRVDMTIREGGRKSSYTFGENDGVPTRELAIIAALGVERNNGASLRVTETRTIVVSPISPN